VATFKKGKTRRFQGDSNKKELFPRSPEETGIQRATKGGKQLRGGVMAVRQWNFRGVGKLKRGQSPIEKRR